MIGPISPEEAVKLILPRDLIGMGLGPGIPDGFMTALGTRDDWEDLVIGGALCLNYYSVFEHPNVSFRCGFFGPAERIHAAAGHRIELVPGGFRQFAPILRRYAPRVMIAQGSMPDEDGMVNLSLHLGATRPELLAAGRDPDRLLIVEVNPKFPRTFSRPPEYQNTLSTEDIDVLVEGTTPPFALDEGPGDDIDAAIASEAIKYVQNGSTLQTGIGAIPNLVASWLSSSDLGDFGVHSELFTDGLMHLHQAGKVSNAHKGIFDGVSVTTFALGSPELYSWLDNNPDVAFLDVMVTNAPDVIGRNAKFVSINGALSVDLYGQVVADNVDGHQVSGVGGHEDFVGGVELSPDGHSLICVRSVVERASGPVSRITGLLPAGAIVSTPRHHTAVVITEYGSADLRGLTVRERAHALVDIAHPDFRTELRQVADQIPTR
ncbi:MAG TPA: acetyl-CoA hydrolase/transferase C-terminal domain-containing protein [Acidimicrobiales bacterium]|nr:acetyl-CoA hydrolase/transferase C-terminal domain-containing protein [Acidimicrobiales bacterium]